jgi:tetratricopeptide (TPR) repeat protein
MVKRIVILFALMISIHTAMAFDTKEFVRDVGHAQQMAAQGKQSEAIAFWEKLKGKYGGAQGHYENALGDLYSNAKLYEKAEKAYLDGIALQGKYPRLYTGLAFVYLHQKKPAEAEKWARRATVEFPSWWLGYYTLGGIARSNDNLESARHWLKKSLDIEPQPQTFWLLAIVAYELKDYRATIDSMEKAINLDKKYLADENGMKASAISLAQLGRYKDAYAAVGALNRNNPKLKDAEVQAIVEEIKRLERLNNVKKK